MGIVEFKNGAAGRNSSHYIWAGLAANDLGKPADVGSLASGSLQVSGNFGAGGCVVLEGSIDGVNYEPLKDVGGVIVRKHGPSIVSFNQTVRFLRLAVVGGDESTKLNCNILVHRGA